MKWLDKLDRKLGKYSIKGLMYYIVIINAAVFLLMQFDKKGIVIFNLELFPSLVREGEFWRLISFIAIPPATSIIWIVFVLYFYYMIGNALEHEWGSFKFNIYYLIGIIVTAGASMLTDTVGSNIYLNLSLFLAFAYLFPNYEILLFFVLPIKMKYLAWVEVAFVGYSIITQPWGLKIAAIVSLLNFIIFFGKDIILRIMHRGTAYQKKVTFSSKIPKNYTIHKCCICGCTEKDDSKMEFRYCNDCEGDYEYCMTHLYSHQHKTEKR